MAANIRLYKRADNALWSYRINDLGAQYARYLYTVLGAGSISVALWRARRFPYNYPLGSQATDANVI